MKVRIGQLARQPHVAHRTGYKENITVRINKTVKFEIRKKILVFGDPPVRSRRNWSTIWVFAGEYRFLPYLGQITLVRLRKNRAIVVYCSEIYISPD